MPAGYGNDDGNSHDEDVVAVTSQRLKDLFNFSFLKWGPRAEEDPCERTV